MLQIYVGPTLPSLHESASWGQKGNIELLIANGANVNAKDEAGKTPVILQLAKPPTSSANTAARRVKN